VDKNDLLDVYHLYEQAKKHSEAVDGIDEKSFRGDFINKHYDYDNRLISTLQISSAEHYLIGKPIQRW